MPTNDNSYCEELTYSRDVCGLMRRVNSLEDGLYFPIEDSRHTIEGSDLWDGTTVVDYRGKGAAWDSDGNLWIMGAALEVTNPNLVNAVLKKFDSDYDLVGTWTTRTTYYGSIANHPKTVLVDGDDNVIIVWHRSNSIQVLDTSGSLVHEFQITPYDEGTYGYGPRHHPVGPCVVGSDGYLYVLMIHWNGINSGSYYYIDVWSVAGAHQTSFTLGSYMPGDGYYHGWVGLSIGGDGEIVGCRRKTLITDSDEYYIYWDRFSLAGVSLSSIAVSGATTKTIQAPLYRDGKYLSSSAESHMRFGVYTPAGVQQSCFGQGEIDTSVGNKTATTSQITIDADDNVRVVYLPYVAGDAYNAEIVHFAPGQTEFQGYTKGADTYLDGTSLGTPDGGVDVPADNALVGYDFVWQHIKDVCDAIDRLARYFVCPDGPSAFYRFNNYPWGTDGLYPAVDTTGEDFLYRCAMADVRGDYGRTATVSYIDYSWRHYHDGGGAPYDILPGQAHECLTLLESADLLGDLS